MDRPQSRFSHLFTHRPPPRGWSRSPLCSRGSGSLCPLGPSRYEPEVWGMKCYNIEARAAYAPSGPRGMNLKGGSWAIFWFVTSPRRTSLPYPAPSPSWATTSHTSSHSTPRRHTSPPCPAPSPSWATHSRQHYSGTIVRSGPPPYPVCPRQWLHRRPLHPHRLRSRQKSPQDHSRRAGGLKHL